MAPSARRLYLVRHAIAAERGPEWPDDARRPLTERGAARMRQVMKGFVALDEPLSLVLTSPLTRALETAEIVAAAFDRRPPVRVLPALAPGVTASDAAAAIAAAARSARRVALVGHEPDLGTLAAWLIGARQPVRFKKGGICRIDVTHWPPDRHGQLAWMAPPKMLRRRRD